MVTTGSIIPMSNSVITRAFETSVETFQTVHETFRTSEIVLPGQGVRFTGFDSRVDINDGEERGSFANVSVHNIEHTSVRSFTADSGNTCLTITVTNADGVSVDVALWNVDPQVLIAGITTAVTS